MLPDNDQYYAWDYLPNTCPDSPEIGDAPAADLYTISTCICQVVVTLAH